MKIRHTVVTIRNLLHEAEDALRKAERDFQQNRSEQTLIALIRAATKAGLGVLGKSQPGGIRYPEQFVIELLPNPPKGETRLFTTRGRWAPSTRLWLGMSTMRTLHHWSELMNATIRVANP